MLPDNDSTPASSNQNALDPALSQAALAPMPAWRAALLFAPIALLIFAVSWQPVGSFDFWAHAAVGRWIVEHRCVPTHTLFLWTAHNPWIAHSWLTEILIYELIKGKSDEAASSAMLIATAITAMAAFAVLWCDWRSKGLLGPGALLVFGLAVIGSHVRFQPRAEMLSALLYVLLLVTIDRIRAERTDSLLRATICKVALSIAALVILWVNLHGMFAFGLLILLLGAIASFIDRRWTVPTQLLACAAGIAIACSLINPYGYHLWKVLLAIQSQTFSQIIEWYPLIGAPWLDPMDLTYLGILTLLSIAALIRNPRRSAVDIIILAALLFEVFRYRRYMYFVGLTCVWVLGNNLAPTLLLLRQKLEDWPRSNSAPGSAGAPRFVAAMFCALILAAWIVTFWPSGNGRFVKLAASEALPTADADWILAHHVTDNVLNDYDNASYLEWRFEHGPLLAVDALNAYPDSVQAMCSGINSMTPQGQIDLAKVNCYIGKVPRSIDHSFPEIYYVLHNSPYWVEVFPAARSGPIWLRLPPGVRRTKPNPIWKSNIPNAPGREDPNLVR